MSRAAIVARLDHYRAKIAAPVIEGVDVSMLERRNGRFQLTTSRGRWLLDAWWSAPAPISVRSGRPALMTSPHSSRLWTPAPTETQMPCPRAPSSSLAAASRVPDRRGALRRRTSGDPFVRQGAVGASEDRRPRLLWWALETGFLDGTLDSLPSPAARLTANVTASGVGGGHDLHARTLHAKGVALAGRFAGSDDDRLYFEDDLADTVAWDDARNLEFTRLVETLCAQRGIAQPPLPRPDPFDATGLDSIRASEIGSVISSGGFRPDYSWVRVPGAFDEMGFPAQIDGASTVASGLFFVGVHFLRKRKSSLLCGVGEDAAIVAAAVSRYDGSA